MSEPFDLYHSLYVALVHRSDVETTPHDPVRAAVYAPATVCAWYVDHERRDGASHVLLLDTRDGWALVGPDCFQSHYPDVNPRPWIAALDRLHSIAGSGLGAGWRSGTRRKYWRLVPVMAMMLQVEPGHETLRNLLTRATQENRREFTHGEKRVLLEIFRERGGRGVTVGQDRQAWAREMRAHHRVVRQRRDLVLRLSRLAALDLRQYDRETAESLLQACTSRRQHRMGQLSPAQLDLVETLERRYFDQRREASEALAQALGERLPR